MLTVSSLKLQNGGLHWKHARNTDGYETSLSASAAPRNFEILRGPAWPLPLLPGPGLGAFCSFPLRLEIWAPCYIMLIFTAPVLNYHRYRIHAIRLFYLSVLSGSTPQGRMDRSSILRLVSSPLSHAPRLVCHVAPNPMLFPSPATSVLQSKLLSN